MRDLNAPLDDSELDRLGQFLLDRIDEDADTEGKDEGVLDVSELDGMFTAIVSGPVSIPPSRWLPAVWGDFEPIWKRKKDFEDIFSLMIRHMNSIVLSLMNEPGGLSRSFWSGQSKIRHTRLSMNGVKAIGVVWRWRRSFGRRLGGRWLS